MKTSDWKRIQEIFDGALDLEPHQRAHFLHQVCAGDVGLKDSVERLISAHGEAGSFLKNPVRLEASDAPASRNLPHAIGQFRIERLLGEGGMGLVYQAEQQHPRRTVALKVIRAGMLTEEALRRFEREAAALGRLQHAGIAQIYEAGTADTGAGPQPYFALEYVPGVTLTEFVRAHNSSTRQKLILMAQVCDAVAHAHQRGVIHRDLKPGNILVDRNGQPKVLDFGVSRLIDSDRIETLCTSVGQIIGTLAYMSPEQVQGDPLAIDERTDVYSLGLIFYELLTGNLPYSVKGLALPEAVRVIREEEATALSSRDRLYRGDIETIAARAIEKDKARRYASVAEFHDDIDRFLEDQPILARAPSASYRLGKFARRHKALVSGAATIFLTLALGIAASSWEAIKAVRAERQALQERDRASVAEQASRKALNRAVVSEQLARAERDKSLLSEAQAHKERNRALSERHRADSEAETARAVNRFLENDLLAQASASKQATATTRPDPDLKVRTALDRAAGKIGGTFKDRPAVEASIRQTIGATYQDLGIPAEALKHFEIALALRRKVLGNQHPDTLRSVNGVAGAYRSLGKYTQAEESLREAVAIGTKSLGPENPETLRSMRTLALVYRSQAKYSQAAKLHAKVLEIRRRVLGPEDIETLRSMNDLALVFLYVNRYKEARRMNLELLEIRRRVLGNEHPDTLISMHNLGLTEFSDGNYPQAAEWFQQALRTQLTVLGDQHPDTSSTRINLANVYMQTLRYSDAAALYENALETARRVLGEGNAETLNAMNNLATAYRAQGRYEEAESLLSRAWEGKRRVLGEQHPETLRSQHNLARIFWSESKYSEAERLLLDVIARRERLSGPDNLNTLTSKNDLAVTYLDSGQFAKSEQLELQLVQSRRQILGPQAEETLDSLATLALAEYSLKKYDAAESTSRELLASYRKKGTDTWRSHYAECLLGTALAAQQQFIEAGPLLRGGYAALLKSQDRMAAYDRPKIERAHTWLESLPH